MNLVSITNHWVWHSKTAVVPAAALSSPQDFVSQTANMPPLYGSHTTISPPTKACHRYVGISFNTDSDSISTGSNSRILQSSNSCWEKTNNIIKETNGCYLKYGTSLNLNYNTPSDKLSLHITASYIKVIH